MQRKHKLRYENIQLLKRYMHRIVKKDNKSINV